MSSPESAVALFDACEDDLQAPLDALMQAELVRIKARHPLVHQPEPTHKGLGEVDHLLGVILQRSDELVVRNREAFGIGDRPDCRGTWPGLDQAHLAEDFARVQGRENFRRGAMVDADLDRA